MQLRRTDWRTDSGVVKCYARRGGLCPCGRSIWLPVFRDCKYAASLHLRHHTTQTSRPNMTSMQKLGALISMVEAKQRISPAVGVPMWAFCTCKP